MNDKPLNEWIVDTNDENFARDVLERSRDLPVVVDFWAEWCAPCRMLGPELEALADEYQGKFVLVRADTEQTASAAGQFNVSSIPAVFAVVQGEPVDSFMGALSRDQIRPWIDQIIRSASFAKATQLEQTDVQAAEATYRELHQAAPNDTEAAIGLARVLLAQNRDDECRETLQALAATGFMPAEGEKLRTQLELHNLKVESVEDLRAAADAEPNDLSRQLKLAEVLAANQEFAEAFELLLAIIAQDRQNIGETARQKMVDMFRLLPDDSELLRDYRRKLSMALY